MSEHGNNTAMREALIVAKANLDSMGANALEGELNPDAVAMICARISARIDAALAKPPRNCDKYANVKDAKTAWFNYKMSCPTPPGGWGDVDLLDWFLAPAEKDCDER